MFILKENLPNKITSPLNYTSAIKQVTYKENKQLLSLYVNCTFILQPFAYILYNTSIHENILTYIV